MNQLIQHTDEGSLRAVDLSDWLVSRGISSASTEDVAHLLGIPRNQVSQRMAALRGKGIITAPARGLWVPVPPEYRTWGAPEPAAYLDDMMHHLGSSYCVGWLTSAALHGASHHAVQVFQVAASKQIRSRAVGRSELEFFQRTYLDEIGIVLMSLPLGRMRVASVATTMLMVCGDVDMCGGIDNVANIAIELAEEADDVRAVVDEVCRNAHAFPAAAARRLGWLMESFTDCGKQDRLALHCAERSSSLSVLSPQSQRGGFISKRWHLEINREVAPDV